MGRDQEASAGTSTQRGLAPPRWLIVGIVLLTIVRLITAATAGFSEDDAYYRLWGLAPAWGYYDHAPMVGWWAWLGMAFAGDTVLGVRLLAPLATGFGSLVMWRMAALLFDDRTATRSVLAFNAMSLVAIGSVVQTPDVPALLFTGLALWALTEWLRGGGAHWWFVVGAMAGLGLLSKYSVLFLGAGICLWLLATARTGCTGDVAAMGRRIAGAGAVPACGRLECDPRLGVVCQAVRAAGSRARGDVTLSR
ncbi:MAG: glycosyltransferase family 39 protein [Rhodospirillales bacterium]|nr:glycosyltransferase family 39 protein [Rhodospirillales bacterium]